MKSPLQQAFEQWLKENNAEVGILIKAPVSGGVPVENFLPPGWTPTIMIVPKEAKPTNGDSA